MRQCGSRGSCTGPPLPPPASASLQQQTGNNPCKEVRYPFGVQNDLGHVQIPHNNKAEHSLLSGADGRCSPVGAGLCTPPTFARTAQGHRLSTPSLQSTSLQCSYASSCDLTADALMLERAIRANDPLRVKRFLNIHHDKFQVNLHGSLLGKSSSEGSQSGDVEILLRKSKTLIDRLEPADVLNQQQQNQQQRAPSPGRWSQSSCSSDSSSSTFSSGGHGEVPLVFSNALHMAVEYGAVDVLRILLKYGLEPNQGGRLPAGCCVEHPVPVPQQPSSPTTTSPTRTSLTGGLSEPSPVTASLPMTHSGLSVGGVVGSLGAYGGGPSRRVSWVSAAKPERRRRATFKALSRQRSFSLESNSEMLRPWAGERRSVSLKSSPLVSPKPAPVGATSSAPLSTPSSVPRAVASSNSCPGPSESPKPPERSIFAELRRSSEIFKSILLNLSMKEQEVEDLGLEPPSPAYEPQIDVNDLLAAHDKFRFQEEELYAFSSSSESSSSSVSSLSSSDDDLETQVNPQEEADVECCSKLAVNPNLPQDKALGLTEVYSRPYLLTLPVLFLAVVRGNPTIVYLLLKYGAAVNFQDTHGNTALHLAVARDNVPWDCVVELVENGAQVSLPNRRGVTAATLAPGGLLTALQQNMIDRSWPGETASADTPTAPASVAASTMTTNRGGTPARILKKLRSNKGEVSGGEEGGSNASVGEPREISSTGSARSSLNRSPDLIKEGLVEGKKRESENRKSRGKRKWRESTRERQPSNVSEKVQAIPLANSQRGFHVLLQMSSNPEVLGFILRGLLAHISKLLKLLQQRNDQMLHRNMAALLHKLLKTALEAYGGESLEKAGPIEAERRKVELSAACCLLLKTCLTLIHGVHDLQFTAMVTINKVIDTCVVYRLAHLKVKVSDVLQHPAMLSGRKQTFKDSSEELEGKQDGAAGTKRAKGKTAKRLGSVWRHAAGEHLEQVRRTLAAEIVEHEESVIDVLSSVHAMSVLNILHNALTLYKRVIGSKQQCTPSQRWRHCSYHCLQLLAARALLFMVEGATVQSQLAQEPQLRILAAALDSTHDPQLLVLVLQIVATLAMDPANHRALTDQGLPDVLSQLLLPSDEWYYTNHSTKYARYVKHHVARILVYLGFQHRVNLRFSVYDILQDDAPPPTPLLESVEDTYIINTSAPPSSVSCGLSKSLLGVSVESAVICVLKAIESSLSQAATADNTTLHWVLSGHSYYSHTMSLIQHQERRVPQDPSSSGFVQCFLACYPCVLSPVILLRLLLHRLLTTAAHLQRWKSCTSRSSFASAAHEVPRSPRSRASSTDTEPSTLRNRRKVNLTVDCTGFGSDHAGGAAAAGHRPIERVGSLVPRDSIGSVSGLEPAMQAIFAFSHILRTRSKESIHSGESSDGRLSPSDFRPLAAFNLHYHQKTRSSFRFSSLRHSNKQRSKSHANITKVLHNPDAVGHRETPEQEILAFQKQLQNLPDFDSPEGGGGAGGGPGGVGDSIERPHLRPRSRSMPRVTYEGSRYLTLPEHTWAKIPRGRSAGALGLQADHHPPTVNLHCCSSPELPIDNYCVPMFLWNDAWTYRSSICFGNVYCNLRAYFPISNSGPIRNKLPSPVSTPLEERRVSNGAATVHQPSSVSTAGPNSRRSSLSPSDRAARRRDSPACVGLEIPPWHRAILSFIEEWLRVSRIELERNPAVCRELRDVMAKISPLGTPYQQWCAEFRQEFPVLMKDPDLESADDLEETNKEYCYVSPLFLDKIRVSSRNCVLAYRFPSDPYDASSASIRLSLPKTRLLCAHVCRDISSDVGPKEIYKGHFTVDVSFVSCRRSSF
ncbi:phospholipase C [Nesidiocoris tenuis]|uniref:Phospholipase C n=1 Tax=Nesidiocoris tenuis TaxID=355587 RepID=A0ABN7BB76_9HEMI|nr:phospholipase C [Nesidiocoris tenuis]